LSEIKQIENRLKAKLSWLVDYQQDLCLWQGMVQLTRLVEKQVKIFGFNKKTSVQLVEKFSSLPIHRGLEPFKQKILKYLQFPMNLIKDSESILGTSDVLESIFGKYKEFSQRCPLKDFRQMLVIIPLFTMNLTDDVIKKALETVRSLDLSQWISETFGQSMLSKRKSVFSTSFDDMEIA